MSPDPAPPVLFAFGVHLHQPVGNFDSVFEDHLARVYRPLLDALRTGGALPVTFHVSGPLLDWLGSRAPDWLDTLGTLAADGRVELLLSGYDEPILAALSREDRAEQIGRMREALRGRFGVEATGLWLTERVWEPDLAADLAASGVEYVLVDDRHFLVAGFEREQLHQAWRTEADGSGLTVFPIDERLRYLIPFRPAREFEQYVDALRSAGHRLAVLADDGEKFGGWPGTYTWVYEKGWMSAWVRSLERLAADGTLRLVTCREALDALPSGGLAYLPSASYRELEEWALPATAGRRLLALEAELGRRIQGPEGALVRGSHWRHFLVKYPEANRMHKKMLRLSRMCREQGDRAETRRAIGLAQCNDAYWHGVFGGLYLPFLRSTVWRHLGRAEALLRERQQLAWESLDADWDGHPEVLIHSPAFSAVLAPARGGALEEHLNLATGVNAADVLTRRREAYHEPLPPRPAGANDAEGMPSIHDIEKHLVAGALPPVDREARALFVERLIGGEPTEDAFIRGAVPVARSWATEPFAWTAEMEGGAVLVTLDGPDLRKVYRFEEDGTVDLTLTWEPPATETWFTTELSLSLEAGLHVEAPGATRWTYPVETLAKSESGFDRQVQGTGLVLGWRTDVGEARIRLVIAD